MDTLFDITADLDTPVSAYLKLFDFNPRFLLESVEGGEFIGRYSFIGFGDSQDYRLNGQAPAEGAGRNDVLEEFRQELRRAPRPSPEHTDIPFNGGLVGYTSYGFNTLLEPRVTAGSGTNSVLAAFCAPGSILVFDHVTRRMALLHDGSDAERYALRRQIIRALGAPVRKSKRPRAHAVPAASMSRDKFLDAVGYAKEQIAAGEVYQLVLSIQFSGDCDTTPFDSYRALRLLNPSPYMYFCEFPDIAVVGSSPEALVKLNGREASLRPIAGTRPRGVTPDDDGRLKEELLADAKEAAEHVMLVDLARNDLGRVAVNGTVDVDIFRAVEKYSHVMHLVSNVRGVLRPDADAFDLFGASFPAGTVVGAPKIRAMELIDEIEPVARGVYAGTVGYFGHGGTMDQAIAIRTLIFEDGEFVYQAGAGIVADSVAEAEYQEILAKSAVLETSWRDGRKAQTEK